jgi:hypothetical protein
LSIVCVVGIATAALFWLREGHEQKEQKDHAKLVSEEILVIAPFFRDDQKDKELGVSPASGQPRPEFTDLLQSQLRRAGSDLEVVVTQPDETARPVASVKF